MEQKFFKKPKTIFQQNINEIVSENNSSEVIECILKLNMFKNAEKDSKYFNLIELYDLVGLDTFLKIVEMFSGKSLKIPKKDSILDSIKLAIFFYKKKVEGYSWQQIKDLFYGDESISSIKYGMKIQNLSNFINECEERISHRNNKKVKGN